MVTVFVQFSIMGLSQPASFVSCALEFLRICFPVCFLSVSKVLLDCLGFNWVSHFPHRLALATVFVQHGKNLDNLGPRSGLMDGTENEQQLAKPSRNHGRKPQESQAEGPPEWVPRRC